MSWCVVGCMGGGLLRGGRREYNCCERGDSEATWIIALGCSEVLRTRWQLVVVDCRAMLIARYYASAMDHERQSGSAELS